MNFSLYESWIGTPYVWWKPGDRVFDVKEPFWTRDGPLPSPEELRAKGCNCAGFLNLVRRSVGMPAVGGTTDWWNAVEKEPFDPNETYPVGTLFLASYVSPDDQGHLMLQGPNGVLHSIPSLGLVCQKVPDWEWWGICAQVPPQKWIAVSLRLSPHMLDYTFLYALEGARYGNPASAWFNVESPYWTSDLPLLPPEVLQERGCNNAGLGNLARRSAGLSALGSMSSWWGAYALLGETYKPHRLYPAGTLLLRAPTGKEDPGHLGIVTPRGVLHSTSEGGVAYDVWNTEPWTVAVDPDIWLTTSM